MTHHLHPTYDTASRVWFVDEPVRATAPTIRDLISLVERRCGGPVTVQDYYPAGRPADLDIAVRDAHFNRVQSVAHLSCRIVGQVTKEQMVRTREAKRRAEAPSPRSQLNTRLGSRRRLPGAQAAVPTPNQSGSAPAALGRPAGREWSWSFGSKRNRSYDAQAILNDWAAGHPKDNVLQNHKISQGTLHRILRAGRELDDARASVRRKLAPPAQARHAS